MTTIKLKAEITGRDFARTVAGVLQDLIEPPPAALTLFEQGETWAIEAYYEDMTEAATVNQAISDALGQHFDLFAPEAVPDLNWVQLSQAALPPVTAGRFTVHGSHDCGRVARGPNAIVIDAGEAFGTAHHATTLGCLCAVDRVTRKGKFRRILDLGSGTGVLAIAASRALPGAAILASDLDQRSVEVAAANIKLNGAGRTIVCIRAAGLNHPLLRRKPFDLIIANILAAPLVNLAPAIARASAPGATVILSGLLIHQAPEVLAAYRASGFRIDRQDRITGWSTLTLRRTGY